MAAYKITYSGIDRGSYSYNDELGYSSSASSSLFWAYDYGSRSFSTSRGPSTFPNASIMLLRLYIIFKITIFINQN